MRSVLTSFWLPRHGSPADQYEDAFFPRRGGVRLGARLRVAIADGASESMLSGLWAELLVRSWCRARRRGMDEVVELAMSAWQEALRGYLDSRRAAHRPIEWFEEPGLDRGAHATVLGVELDWSVEAGLTWTAESLGDSCLFQVRGDELVAAFPLEDAAAFGNAPKLVPTQARQLDRVVASLERAEGRCEDGDVLFLATDAVAAWFLATAAAGGTPWRELAEVVPGDAAGFATWALERRRSGALRNDDVTVLRLEVSTG